MWTLGIDTAYSKPIRVVMLYEDETWDVHTIPPFIKIQKFCEGFEELLAVCSQSGIIIVEKPAYPNRNFNVVCKLGMVVGGITVLATRYGYPVYQGTLQTVRSDLGIKGKTRAVLKDAARQYVKDRIDMVTNDDDMAESALHAIWLMDKWKLSQSANISLEELLKIGKKSTKHRR